MNDRTFNLNDLAVFVHLVDHRGFAAAARALRVPKSTLSKRLFELEKATGVRLLERSSRVFVVTDVGREFYEHASAMVQAAEAARGVIRGRLAEPSGIVRLTASVPTAQLLLAPLVPALAQAWPKLRLVLHASDRFVDIIPEGFDLAVRDHFAPLPNSDLVQRRLGLDPNYLVASPDYLKRRGDPDSPELLHGHDGLLVSPSHTVWTLRQGRGAATKVTPVPRLFADESVVLLKAAAASCGVACLPARLCHPYLEDGSLVRVLPGWTAGGVTTSLLIPRHRLQLPAVRAVADHLMAHLRG